MCWILLLSEARLWSGTENTVIKFQDTAGTYWDSLICIDSKCKKKKKNYYFDFFVASRMYLSEEHIDKTMELTGFISYVTRTSLIYFLTMPRNGSSFYENDYHKKDVGWSRGRLYDTRDHHYVLAVRTFISLSFT